MARRKKPQFPPLSNPDAYAYWKAKPNFSAVARTFPALGSRYTVMRLAKAEQWEKRFRYEDEEMIREAMAAQGRRVAAVIESQGINLESLVVRLANVTADRLELMERYHAKLKAKPGSVIEPTSTRELLDVKTLLLECQAELERMKADKAGPQVGGTHIQATVDRRKIRQAPSTTTLQ